MTPIKRPMAAAGAAVLLALSLSACGGGAPTDASKDDYCEAVQGTSGDEEFSKALEDKDWDKIADLYKDAADDVEEVGTPDDISDEEREGFEIQLDAIKSVNGDDIEKAFNSEGEDPFEDEFSDDEKDKVKAYQKYESETCADSGSDSGVDTPSIDPSDVPSIDPSDVPSIDPSDLPSIPEELQSQLDELTESPSTE